jgi:hypothetical protein
MTAAAAADDDEDCWWVQYCTVFGAIDDSERMMTVYYWTGRYSTVSEYCSWKKWFSVDSGVDGRRRWLLNQSQRKSQQKTTKTMDNATTKEEKDICHLVSTTVIGRARRRGVDIRGRLALPLAWN